MYVGGCNSVFQHNRIQDSVVLILIICWEPVGRYIILNPTMQFIVDKFENSSGCFLVLF